jgi:hypothetical protein
LKQVVANRIGSGKDTWQEEDEPVLVQAAGAVVLDEVTDVIDLPGFVFQRRPVDPETLDLPPAAVAQLRQYVSAVANAYHSNPFHCLQHASQVTTALAKLLSRIVVKQLEGIDEHDEDEVDDDAGADDLSDEAADEAEIAKSIAPHLHNHTYGITSDPLTQFGLVFAAFIHEVDHNGIGNQDIVKEDPESAALYKSRSIIEQRSVDKAWRKLMEPSFSELRKCIYSDAVELKRFRQVVVNCVLSTDINDVELQELRMKRWEKTFSRGLDSSHDVSRRATILLEHLMQSADKFHRSAPWIVYEKWSCRMFEEKYRAFQNKRIAEDPSITWYRNELNSFDNYAIPLAMQLKDCDAFVVSGDEYLNFTLRNRQQLASKGKSMVANFLAKIDGGTPAPPSVNTDTVSPNNHATPEQQSEQSPVEANQRAVSKHVQRLVDWNVEMLQRLLVAIVAKRNVLGHGPGTDVPQLEKEEGTTYLDEVVDVLEFPLFDPLTSPDKLDLDSVDLGAVPASQLREYVELMASKFHDNEFHAFDRASQVCMTARKQLSRVLATTTGTAEDLYDATFGISQDPLAHFAVVFAALFHDVDHPGVPSYQVGLENAELHTRCRNLSVMEQNALDVAWTALMKPDFAELRASIYGSMEEMKRFRQLLVNLFLASDSVDDKLLDMRRNRWERAFVDTKSNPAPESRNRQATIIIEMLISSSDIFYATHNWHLFQKWNERQFYDMYKAYQNGRLVQDPCIFWYKSVLLFFDEHVIPVAKQVNDCGVPELSGDEQLSFALANRQQWAAKGGNLVASMVARYHGKEIEKVRAMRVHRRMSLSAKLA